MTSQRSRSPVSSTAWSCSTRLDRVLRPAKLWNDTESAPEAAALVERWGPRRWADVIGTVPVASITITKLAWLREHEPEHFDRVAHVLLPHDWLTLQLTGEVCTDRGDASGTGYWSPSLEAYVPDALGLVDLDPAVAPTVLAPGEPAGAAAAAWSWPPAPATTWAPRWASGSPRATSRSRSAPRAPCSRCRVTRRTTRRARWPASPMRPVGSCPWRARSTRRR